MDGMTNPASGIWVIIVGAQTSLPPATRQRLASARTLGDQLGAPVAALLLSGADGETPPTQEAIAYGADKVLLVQNEHLATYSAPAYVAALDALATQARPELVLLSDDSLGRDLAPRLAYRLGGGLIAGVDPTTLEVDSYTRAPTANLRRWAGRLVTTYAGGSGTTVITLGSGATLEPYYDDWRYGDTETVDLEAL